MKKIKPWIIGIVLFFIFGGNPIFYIGLFIYIIYKISSKSKSNSVNLSTVEPTKTSSINKINLILKCTNCGSVMSVNHKFCTNCGSAFLGDNVKVELDPNAKSLEQKSVIVNSHQFDSMFKLSEEEMICEFLERELVKAGLEKNVNLIPRDILKRKKILNLIYSFLSFCLISLVFFHFPILTYIFGIIILFFSYKFTKKYNFMEYLKKQIKSRPNEKISNIVMNLKQTMVKDTSNKMLIFGIPLSIILSLIIFIKPMIWYEKVEGGYGVRYYIFGVTNFTSATIPEKHKDENVILLRGNTFSNMPFLKEINLPDTIIEIRGQAFKNNRSLKNIKLPNNLNYLGGGAFYNCTSLESVEIPDSVTYIGGEAFYNAKKLKSIKLSNNISEIKGSTFENCISLQSIEIPDNVIRIGGHAFYGNRSLSSVVVSKNSKLKEIGSSAFRMCTNLHEILLPRNVYINERAFKESPTTKKFYNEYTCNENGCIKY